MANKHFPESTDIDQCKKDILYLNSTIENWKEKPYLFTALISHLVGYPFNYNRDTAIRAYEQLSGKPGMICGNSYNRY